MPPADLVAGAGVSTYGVLGGESGFEIAALDAPYTTHATPGVPTTSAQALDPLSHAR